MIRPSTEDVCRETVTYWYVNTDLRIGAKSHCPTQSLLQSGLGEVSNNRLRIEQEDQIIMVGVQVEFAIRGKKRVHTLGGGQYRIRFLFDGKPTQGRFLEVSGQKRKRFMMLVSTRELSIGNWNMRDDDGPKIV